MYFRPTFQGPGTADDDAQSAAERELVLRRCNWITAAIDDQGGFEAKLTAETVAKNGDER